MARSSVNSTKSNAVQPITKEKVVTRNSVKSTKSNEVQPITEENAMTRKSNNTNAADLNATEATKEVTTMTTHANSPKKSSKKSDTPAIPVTAPATTAVAVTPADTASITSADAAQCQTLLSQISGILGPITALSAGDIRRSLKLRKGGAQVIPQLVDLCQQHGVTSVGSVTAAGLTARKARADALNTIGVNFDAVHKKLNDATFSTESDMWQQAMALYTVLQRLAIIDPTLAQGIGPIEAFFQTKATKGTVRAKVAKRNAAAAIKLAQKYQTPASSPADPTASSSPATASASSSPAVSPTVASVPAPVAVTPASTNGVAHS